MMFLMHTQIFFKFEGFLPSLGCFHVVSRPELDLLDPGYKLSDFGGELGIQPRDGWVRNEETLAGYKHPELKQSYSEVLKDRRKW